MKILYIKDKNPIYFGAISTLNSTRNYAEKIKAFYKKHT
jgi:hypothetical protein